MATDFQNLADSIQAPTSVMSVEVLEDGSMGELRIVAGNRGYIDSIERPAGDYQMKSDKFIPGSIYTDYVPRDLNFEDFCFRSAVQKKCLHSYVKPSHMPVWFNMTFLPAGPPDGNIHYCTYTMEVNFEANTKRMSNVDNDLAKEVLETCIKLRGAKDFKATMQDVIVDLRNMCHAEQCSILLVDRYEKKTQVLCKDFSGAVGLRAGRKNIITPSSKDFYRITESWEELIGSSNCIIAKNEKDMEYVKERTPEWHETLVDSGVNNIALFPLKFGDDLLGYIWVINFIEEYAPKIKEMMELTTFILGSEINSYLLMNRLKILSSKDMLTGVLNRNEMNNYVDKLVSDHQKVKQSVAVVFVDLNGLKLVNDEQGHTAGDAILRDAAAALMEVYPADCIYRAGGDEFTVILPGADTQEMIEGIEKLRKVSEKYERVSFAIGGCVEQDIRDVRTALKIADQRMYEDKREYYVKHPEIRKRLS